MPLCRYLLLLAYAAGAAAQLPPTPDETRYPELAAMKRWLEAGTEPARYCARSGGLFYEASEVYRDRRSEAEAVGTLMKRHGETLGAADRERLRATLAQIASMAVGFVDLSLDSASIAYAQLCIGRAQKPTAALDNATILSSFQGAQRCEQAYAAGSLDRKECVAVAFRVR